MKKVKSYAAQGSDMPLAPFQITRRKPGPSDVHFEILYCGVCHSDIHQVRNEWGGSIYPMVPGHEIVGRVKSVGDKVTKFKTGDLAAVGCLVDSCRTCENCRHGMEQYCRNGSVGTYNSYERDGVTPTYGGYSKEIVVHENFVLKVPGNLPLEGVAPLLCAGVTTWSPLRHWNIGRNHRVGVSGLGGLGHMAVKFAAAFGAEVTMLSTSPKKEADARRLGAQKFLLTTNSQSMRQHRGYFDFIVDTVSAPHDYNALLKLLATNGTLICVGAPPKPVEIGVFNLLAQRKSIAGSMIGGLPETQEMLDYCGTNDIVSDVEVIDMAYINEAYDRMLAGDVRYRFVIDMATL